MNREELLRLLLIERFAPPPSPQVKRHATVADIRAVYNDNDLTTYARRKALGDACGPAVHRSSVEILSTHGDAVTAGQRAVMP